MLLEVILEDDVNCPRCERLLPVLRRICDELNIPFTIKHLGNRAVAAYEEDSASRTFSPEWIEKWGLKEHKRSLKKIAPVLTYIKSIGAQTFPNIVIRWHDGIRTKEIVIRGYDDSDEERAKRFAANLYTLLKTLKQVVYRR